MTSGVGGVQRPQTEQRAAIPAVAAAIHAELGGRCNHDALGDDCCYLAAAAISVAWPIVAAAVEVLAYERAAETIQAEMQRCPPQENNGFDEAWHDGLGEAVRLVRGLAASPVVVSPVEEGKQR